MVRVSGPAAVFGRCLINESSDWDRWMRSLGTKNRVAGELGPKRMAHA